MCPAIEKLASDASAALAKSEKAHIVAKEKVQAVLFVTGNTKNPVIGSFFSKGKREKVTPRDIALSYYARFYVYGMSSTSKSTFDDPYFRSMCEGLYVAGGGNPSETPFLTRKGMYKWVVEEYEIFVLYLNFMLQKCLERSSGNPFAQGMNDCTTLENKSKHIALGIELVDPNLDQNHVICLGLVPILDGYNVTGVAKIQDIVKDVTRWDYEEICCSTISDRAAKGISKLFGHDEDVCQMHDGDKIGKSAVGDLLRTSKKASFDLGNAEYHPLM